LSKIASTNQTFERFSPTHRHQFGDINIENMVKVIDLLLRKAMKLRELDLVQFGSKGLNFREISSGQVVLFEDCSENCREGQ